MQSVGRLIEVGSSEGSVKVDGSSSDGRNKARITDSDSFIVAVFLFFFSDRHHYYRQSMSASFLLGRIGFRQ